MRAGGRPERAGMRRQRVAADRRGRVRADSRPSGQDAAGPPAAARALLRRRHRPVPADAGLPMPADRGAAPPDACAGPPRGDPTGRVGSSGDLGQACLAGSGSSARRRPSLGSRWCGPRATGPIAVPDMARRMIAPAQGAGCSTACGLCGGCGAVLAIWSATWPETPRLPPASPRRRRGRGGSTTRRPATPTSSTPSARPTPIGQSQAQP